MKIDTEIYKLKSNRILFIIGGLFMLIYLVTNTANGKQYIGQTSGNLKNRMFGHYRQSFNYNASTLFARALRKYGKENFKWETICICKDKNDLNEKEKYFIRKFNTYYTDGLGYNMTHGGENNDYWLGKKKPHSKITIEKIRKAKIGLKFSEEHKKNLSISRKKRITKLETIEKMKQSMIGKNVGKYIKIYEFEDGNGNKLITNEGIIKFSKKHNISLNTLKTLINNPDKTYKGLKFKNKIL